MPKENARIYLLLALFSVLFFNEDHPLLFILQPTLFSFTRKFSVTTNYPVYFVLSHLVNVILYN